MKYCIWLDGELETDWIKREREVKTYENANYRQMFFADVVVVVVI